MAALPKPQAKRPKAEAAAAAAHPGVVGVARAHYTRGSTHKTRQVARLVKDRSVVEAMAILATTNKRPARILALVMKSAAANALQQHPQLTEGALRIARIVINEGPMWKRFRAVAMGRATKIRKRTSHITIELSARTP